MTGDSTTATLPSGALVSVGALAIDYEDVLMAGYFAGEWPALVGWSARALQLEATATVSAGELRAAAEAFRRGRHLESGHQLHDWLDERGLTLAGWETHLRRRVLVDASPRGDGSPQVTEALAAVLRTDSFCNDFWSEGAERLVAWALASTLTEAPEETTLDLARVLDEVHADVLSPLCRRDRTWLEERVATLARWARCYQALGGLVASDEAIASVIEEHWTEWSQLSLESCAVTSESAAREAMACAVEDAMAPSEIARRAHSNIERRSVRSGELDDTLAPPLLSSPLGEPVGPLHIDDEWMVVWVRERSAALTSDPEVRTHAAASLVDDAVHSAAKGQVTWHAPR